MIHYASSEDTLRRLSNPRAVKLKLFGTIFYDTRTGNFNEGPRREALEGSGDMPPPPPLQKSLKSESLKTQFPALSGRWLCQKGS